MIRIPKVTMTTRDLDRFRCIQGLIDGQLKQTAVATRLGLTSRQVRRPIDPVSARGSEAAAPRGPLEHRRRQRLHAALYWGLQHTFREGTAREAQRASAIAMRRGTRSTGLTARAAQVREGSDTALRTQALPVAETPDNRHLIGKYLEFFQFPDDRVEIR